MLGMTLGAARWQKLLPALLAALAVLLYAGSSGSFRFGGEDEDSGFGGTGAMPGSGLGGTGLKPWLGDAGEVRIHPQADAVPIGERIVEAEIPRMAAPEPVRPPPAIVSAPEFAASHPAEVSITDSIQTRLRRDALIYQRIVESVEGYLPPEAGPASVRAAAPTLAPPTPGQPLEAQSAQASQYGTPGVSAVAADVEDVAPSTGASEPAAAKSWAELIAHLAENQPAPAKPAIESLEAAAEPAAVQRPQRIRRPELPQVQRGRIVQRPAVLPPRVQPMRF